MTDELDARAQRNSGSLSSGAVTGSPRRLLRMEGLVVLVGATFGYATLDASWWMFALLFLVPDLSMLGYLIDRNMGAVIYNSAHNYLVPAALAATGLWFGIALLPQLALIWAAHVGFDRALGYGLKYPSAFKHTHLGIPRW